MGQEGRAEVREGMGRGGMVLGEGWEEAEEDKEQEEG